MDARPGRLLSPCGVSTATPAQQPQVQPDVPWQLIGGSLSTLHDQRQLAMVGVAGIVRHLRDLQGGKRDLAAMQVLLGGDALGLKDRRSDGGDAGDGARSGVDRAEVNGLAEGEVVRREVAGLAVGLRLAAENLEQRLLDVRLEVIGIGESEFVICFSKFHTTNSR